MSNDWPRAHWAVWLVTGAIAVASWAGLARGQEEATVAGSAPRSPPSPTR